MTARKMTPKMFLFRARSTKSAIAFIAAHREFLETGELASITSPILRRMDDKEVYPTPALEELQQVILNHVLQAQVQQAESKMEAAVKANQTQDKPKDAWIASVYNTKRELMTRFTESGEEQDLRKGFQLSGDADRWCDRRLVLDGEPDWFAEVESTLLHKANGDPFVTVITRDDAMSRFFRRKKQPFTRKTGISSKSLKWQPKAKQDRFSFSAG